MQRSITLILLSFTLLAINNLAHSQCYPDRHNTNAFDSWISCNKSTNPNPAHSGSYHWIQYDLGSVHSVNDIQIWNLNHPDYIKSGIRNVIVDVFHNGSWSTVDTFTIPKAPASGQYEGMLTMDLKNRNARRVLLTALDNHGGACTGFSEIRIYTDNVSENNMTLDFTPCENGGLYKNITAGLELPGGSYSGLGVSDNGDGTFDYNVDLLGPGYRTIYYNHNGGTLSADILILSCFNSLCPICDDCSGGSNLTVNANPIPSDIYKANDISSNGSVNTNYDVEFHAYEGMEIGNGFQVLNNANFEAIIRHCDINLLSNQGFENQEQDWSFWVNTGGGDNATFSTITSNPYEGARCGRIVVNSVGSNNYTWETQLLQNNFSVRVGDRYRISAAIRSNGNSQVEVIAQEQDTWEVFGSIQMETKTYWDMYQFEFTATKNVSNLRVVLQFGYETDTYYVDDIKLAKIN